MENLLLLHLEKRFYNVQQASKLVVHPTNDVVFAASGSEIHIIEKNSKDKVIDFADQIVDFDFLPFSNEICAATDSGSVFLENLENGKRDEVSFCEDGVMAMQFSPDQDVVVFVTR